MTTQDWLKTVCILCESNCGVEVRLEDRSIVRIRGECCIKLGLCSAEVMLIRHVGIGE